MVIESDIFIDNITQLVIQNQDLSFSSQREAQRHLDKTRTDMRKLMKESNALFIAGLHYLKEYEQSHTHTYVASVAGKILKSLDSAKKLQRVIETEVSNQEMSLYLFSEVVFDLVECGDYHKEVCVIAVVMSLFPLNAQPYVYYGSLLWRRDGKQAAEEFYSRIVEVFHDPALDYFAAECFIKNGNREKAKLLLQNAQNNQLMAQENYKNVKMNIQELIEQC